jgi:hypothetical protein
MGAIPTLFVFAAAFAALALVFWPLLSLVWYLARRIGRLTGAGATVDRFFDTDGAQLPDEERIKDDGGFRGGIGGLPARRPPAGSTST